MLEVKFKMNNILELLYLNLKIYGNMFLNVDNEWKFLLQNYNNKKN